jgi:hypothetical protein
MSRSKAASQNSSENPHGIRTRASREHQQSLNRKKTSLVPPWRPSQVEPTCERLGLARALQPPLQRSGKFSRTNDTRRQSVGAGWLRRDSGTYSRASCFASSGHAKWPHIRQGHRPSCPFICHESGNSGNVAKASDDVVGCVEGRKGFSRGVSICRHADRELERLTHERIRERACVPWLFGPRYMPDPNAWNVVLFGEAFLWREIAVENEEDPTRYPSAFFVRRSETVGGRSRVR